MGREEVEGSMRLGQTHTCLDYYFPLYISHMYMYMSRECIDYSWYENRVNVEERQEDQWVEKKW